MADPARVAGLLLNTPREIEDLLRELAPQVLSTLMRRYGGFDACEDATQEALLAAATQWPGVGVPDNARGWLVTVASRKLIDEIRSDQSRRRREDTLVAGTSAAAQLSGDREDGAVVSQDDSLALVFLCCHPGLSAPSQIALTLRAVGGLTTGQIAKAFLVPEATMGQRISRAKQTIRAAGSQFAPPDPAEYDERLAAVTHVLYLIFNEGYTATAGEDLTVPVLSDEAIRLTRWLHRLLPDDAEVTGLLALMLLTEARRTARSRPDGSLVPLEEQDRATWDRDRIAEGVALVEQALSGRTPGPYQVQAAIAALHDEATDAASTDWAQILALYDVLERIAPNPMVTLNRAVAVSKVQGAQAALDLLATLSEDGRVAGHHRLFAVRAHLRESSGDASAARADYLEAARLTTSTPEQRYLLARAERLPAG